MQDLSHIYDLHCSSWQCQILNPLSKAMDRTCVITDDSQICFLCATVGTPKDIFIKQDCLHQDRLGAGVPAVVQWVKNTTVSDWVAALVRV